VDVALLADRSESAKPSGVTTYGTPEQSAGSRQRLTRDELRAWLVASGFAELVDGRLLPTVEGFEVGAALERTAR
jgi:hypothetical protein